jgi:hypothetical protein
VTDASDDVRRTPPASLSCFGADPAAARVVAMAGTCPRCGGAVAQEPRRRLQRPHTVTCSACGETLLLECDTG